MSVLKVHNGDAESMVIPFEGTPMLEEILTQKGITFMHPCGGQGKCGKCAVRAEGALSEPTVSERACGHRLSCQIRLLGDAEVWIPKQQEMQGIAGAEIMQKVGNDHTRLGAAVDIGTTTLAVQVCDLDTGEMVSSAGELNPQGQIAADVVGRIEHALAGKLELLQQSVTSKIRELLDNTANYRPIEKLVITGNTTMLYLLTGRTPEPLSHAPFLADCLFDSEWNLGGIRAYLPPCISAFVGADITCAVLYSRMCHQKETALLCDIGTNGEIALWKDGILYVTSTAAGPAFEGVGISCGCGSVNGAIDRVCAVEGSMQCNTIGNAPAVGICGSGLIDAAASMLELEILDETGSLEEDPCPLRDGIELTGKDIRSLQLAKAAIAAGIRSLMDEAHVTDDDLDKLYIAGSFGSHLNCKSARKIGLIPEIPDEKIVILGNGALGGALQFLKSSETLEEARNLAQKAIHLPLGGSPRFNNHFMQQMMMGTQTDNQDAF